MIDEMRWVDRPRPRFPWPVWLFAAGFWVFFTFVPATWAASSIGVPLAIGWALMSVVVGALIALSYLRVRYELNDRTLRARAGTSSVTFELAEISSIEITPWYAFVHPRNFPSTIVANSWKPMLRIVDAQGRKLLVTPTDPEEMRAEILRRRNQLQGTSGGTD